MDLKEHTFEEEVSFPELGQPMITALFMILKPAEGNMDWLT